MSKFEIGEPANDNRPEGVEDFHLHLNTRLLAEAGELRKRLHALGKELLEAKEIPLRFRELATAGDKVKALAGLREDVLETTIALEQDVQDLQEHPNDKYAHYVLALDMMDAYEAFFGVPSAIHGSHEVLQFPQQHFETSSTQEYEEVIVPFTLILQANNLVEKMEIELNNLRKAMRPALANSFQSPQIKTLSWRGLASEVDDYMAELKAVRGSIYTFATASEKRKAIKRLERMVQRPEGEDDPGGTGWQLLERIKRVIANEQTVTPQKLQDEIIPGL